MVNQAKQLEKQSNFYIELVLKEYSLEKKSERESNIKHFKDEYFQADVAKKLAESVLRAARAKIEDKKNEILRLKAPGGIRTDNFLASEKLASSKKQSSLSPGKTARVATKEKKKRRFKSLSKN